MTEPMKAPQRPNPIGLLLALLLLTAASAWAQAPSPADLEGSTWVLRDLGEGRSPLPVLPVLAVFADGAISGSAGCNAYRAAYAHDATDLALEGIFATKGVCEPLVMAQEDEYLAKLQGATAVRFEGDELVVDYWLDWVDGRYGALRFARHRAPDRLTDASWLWVRYEDSLAGSVDLADPEAFRLTFDGRGRLTLTTDCLDAALPYSVDGANVAINTRGLDRSACAGDSPSWRLAGDLASVRIVSFHEGRLLLELFADSGALVFERAP